MLACGIHRVDPEGHTVVHFHGNGETVADWQGTLDRAINARGWDLLLAEYRGYGGSTGIPLLGRMLDDVPAVIAAGGLPEKTVVMGRSVGSIFALEAVSRYPTIAGLILESAIADPIERILLRVRRSELGGTRADWDDLEERLDHRRKISGYRGPTLILHTRRDSLVDVAHARQLAAWAGGPIRLHIFDEGDHNSILQANSLEYLVLLSVAPPTGRRLALLAPVFGALAWSDSWPATYALVMVGIGVALLVVVQRLAGSGDSHLPSHAPDRSADRSADRPPATADGQPAPGRTWVTR